MKWISFLAILLNMQVGLAQLSWSNLTGVSVSASGLCKNVATGWNNSGGFSVNHIATSTDGQVKYIIDTGTNKAFGLSNSDPDLHYTSIDHAFVFNSGQVEIWESGSMIGMFGMHHSLDSFRIKRQSSSVYYYINGMLVHTSSATSGNLHLDFAIDDMNECFDGFEVTMDSVYYPYCELLKAPDGGFYRTFDFKLRVKYDEEYSLQADKKLYYNIYNKLHTVVASASEGGTLSPAGSPVPDIDYGENYLTLDLASLTLTIGDFYLLEVINRKNEKRYLKFIVEQDLPN